MSSLKILPRTSVRKKLRISDLAKFYDRILRRIIGKTVDNIWKIEF